MTDKAIRDAESRRHPVPAAAGRLASVSAADAHEQYIKKNYTERDSTG